MSQQQSKSMIRPMGNRVLVKRLEAQESLKGGLILPDTAKKKQEVAQVIALGTGKKTPEGQTIPFPVAVGDKILMEKYSGQDVQLQDEEYVIVGADDIIAIVQ